MTDGRGSWGMAGSVYATLPGRRRDGTIARRQRQEGRMDLELRGRNAVVTGCSVGIGREIARVLAAEGASTLVIARRGELLKTLHDEIEGAGWKRPHALAIHPAHRPSAARGPDAT